MARAFKHLKDLDGQVALWVNGDHHSVRLEYDPKARGPGPLPAGQKLGFGVGVLTALATAEQPPADPFSLLIGDALHNMRSALDTLAYALAVAHKKPLPKEIADSSEFPIFGDEDRNGVLGVGSGKFHQPTRTGDPAPGSGLSKIAGWDPKAKTIVEGLQPYHRGSGFRSDPLWVLHELDRINKHRLLHTTVASFSGTVWGVPFNASNSSNVQAAGPGFLQSLEGTIETDTPIARIYGIIRPIDPSAEMHVEINPALDVAFGSRVPIAGGEPVSKVLWSIHEHIGRAVLPRLMKFLI
jgi:hypothetical protein